MIQILLKAGLDVNARSRKGETPLMELCRFGGEKAANAEGGIGELIDDMLCVGMELDLVQDKGKTALHVLAAAKDYDIENRAELARVLLERGADLYIEDRRGALPFRYAITEARDVEDSTLLRLLCQHHSDYRHVLRAMVRDVGRTAIECKENLS